MSLPKEGYMTYLFSHGFMDANMFDMISIYIGMKWSLYACNICSHEN